jgi:hypothetical protein
MGSSEGGATLRRSRHGQARPQTPRSAGAFRGGAPEPARGGCTVQAIATRDS